MDRPDRNDPPRRSETRPEDRTRKSSEPATTAGDDRPAGVKPSKERSARGDSREDGPAEAGSTDAPDNGPVAEILPTPTGPESQAAETTATPAVDESAGPIEVPSPVGIDPETTGELGSDGAQTGVPGAGLSFAPATDGPTLEPASTSATAGLQLGLAGTSAVETKGQVGTHAALEAEPSAETDDAPDAVLPDNREAFAEHLRTEPAGEKASGLDPTKLAEGLERDGEQPAQSSGAVQAGPAQKPGQTPQAANSPNAQVPVAHQVPLGAVPIEIGLKAIGGINRFEIRLDPAELGRIDVTLDIGEGGEVKAHLVVDRVETLALLQRDAKTLERAFEQAGLKPSEGGVDLSLRDPSGDGRSQQQNQDERGRSEANASRDDGAESERPERTAAPVRPLRWQSARGVDLRI